MQTQITLTAKHEVFVKQYLHAILDISGFFGFGISLTIFFCGFQLIMQNQIKLNNALAVHVLQSDHFSHMQPSQKFHFLIVPGPFSQNSIFLPF